MGAGNISQAIIKDILESRPTVAARILATAPSNDNLVVLKNLGCRTSLLVDLKFEVESFEPEFVFLCIEPQVFSRELRHPESSLRSLLRVLRKQMIVSLMTITSPIDGHNSMTHTYVRLIIKNPAEIGATSIFYIKPASYAYKSELERDKIDMQLERLRKVLGLFGETVLEVEEDTLPGVMSS